MSEEVKDVEWKSPSKVSRYKAFKAYMTRENVYLENPSYIEVPEHPDDTFFLVTGPYVDRLDLISHKFYNESKLWWVIAEANQIINPLEVPINSLLRIPAKSTLFGAGGLIGNG